MRNVLVVALVAVVVAGCATSNFAKLRLPDWPRPAVIEEASQLGGLWAVRLQLGGSPLSFYLPDTEACRVVATTPRAVYFREEGAIGVLESEGMRCEPVGIGSLRFWRDRRPRAAGRFAPRSHAVIREVAELEDSYLVRGRFPTARFLGWTGAEDTIAVLPRSADCSHVLSRPAATLEFRASGRTPLSFVAKTGRCPVLGLVRPGKTTRSLEWMEARAPEWAT